MTLVPVQHEVVTADENPARTVTTTRDSHEKIGAIINRLRDLAGDMVEPQVKLVEGEELLRLVGGLPRGVAVRLGVLELDGGEDGVVEPAVERGEGEGEGVGLVGLERGRDGEARGGVAVEDVDELLLLERGDAERAALGVDGEELAGYDAAAARLAEGLLVDLVEAVAVGGVLEDDEAARIGADDEVVLVGAGEAELRERADGAEDVDGEERAEAARVRVRAEEVERAAPGHGDLLRGAGAGPGGGRLLRVPPAEAADDGAHRARRALQRQAVEIHGGGEAPLLLRRLRRRRGRGWGTRGGRSRVLEREVGGRAALERWGNSAAYQIGRRQGPTEPLRAFRLRLVPCQMPPR